jgi:hypothetical protein
MTICTECKHFMKQGPIWYDQLCSADKRPLVRDPVSGDMLFEGVNDLGQRYTTSNPHPYARDVNVDGHCPLFATSAAERGMS